MTNPIIYSTFKTPIGQVVCGLTSNLDDIKIAGTREYENGKSVIYNSGAHSIELIEFKIRRPLYNGERVTDSNGWIWRIEKNRKLEEKLTLSCVLKDYSNNVAFNTALGEHLDAIEARDDEWILHIGTEDGEILNARAASNDWFPKRFENHADFCQSITSMLKEGFETEVPDLLIGEQIHIQFLTAYDKQNQESVNTWLAVDEFKKKLENWIGL